MPDDLDGTEPIESPEVAASETPAAPEVEYELDESAPASSASSDDQAATPRPVATPSPVAPAGPPADSIDYRARSLEVERQLNELRSTIAPILQERQRTLAETANKPPVSLERLQSGEATAQELVEFTNWQIQQGLGQLSQTLAHQTRVAHSEAQARGQFSAEAMGAPDRSYDALRATYLEPAYQRNPALREHVYALAPDDPAVAEMWAATILRARSQHQGNELAALKSVMDAIGARVAGAEDTTRAIEEAARRGADRVIHDRGPGAAQRQRLDSKAIWDLSDAEFERLQQQHGVG